MILIKLYYIDEYHATLVLSLNTRFLIKFHNFCIEDCFDCLVMMLERQSLQMLEANTCMELTIPVSNSSTIWLHISNSNHQNVTKKNAKHLSKINQKLSQMAITTDIVVLCKALLVLRSSSDKSLAEIHWMPCYC